MPKIEYDEADPKYLPKYNTTSQLYRDVFQDTGVDAQSAKRALMTGNVDLLVETVCLLLEHRANDLDKKQPFVKYNEKHAWEYLGVNAGYLTANSEYGALFYTLCCTENFDLIDFFRILRSRTDWTAETFRAAWLASEFRQYKQWVVDNLIHVPPNWYSFFFFSKIFELTFAPIEKDGVMMVGDEVMNWCLPSIDQDINTNQLTWATQIFGPFDVKTSQEYINSFYTRVVDASFYSGNFDALDILLNQRMWLDLTTPPSHVDQRPSQQTKTLKQKYIPRDGAKLDIPLAVRKALITRRPYLAYGFMVDQEQQIKHYQSLIETASLQTEAKMTILRQNQRDLLDELEAIIIKVRKSDDDDNNKEITIQAADLVSNLVELNYQYQTISSLQKQDKNDNKKDKKNQTKQEQDLTHIKLQISKHEEELQALFTNNTENTIINVEIKDKVNTLKQITTDAHHLDYEFEYTERKYQKYIDSHRILKDDLLDYLRGVVSVLRFDLCYAQDIFFVQLLACHQDDPLLLLLLSDHDVPFKNLELTKDKIDKFIDERNEVQNHNDTLRAAYHRAITSTDEDLQDEEPYFRKWARELRQYKNSSELPYKTLPRLATLDNVHFDFNHRVHRKPLLRTENLLTGIPDAMLTFSTPANLDFATLHLLTFNLTGIVDDLIKYINKNKLITPKPPAPTKEEREAAEKEAKEKAAKEKAAAPKKGKKEKMMEMLTGGMMGGAPGAGPMPGGPQAAGFKPQDDDDDFFSSEFGVSTSVTSPTPPPAAAATDNTDVDPTSPISPTPGVVSNAKQRKIVNINDISNEKNYIAQMCGSHITRSSTVQYLLNKKSKLNTNSKQGQENNAFLLALSCPYADAKSRDEMLCLIFDFISQPDKKYLPLLTSDEYWQVVQSLWARMNSTFHTHGIIAPQFATEQTFNAWNIYYDDKSELILHTKRLVPTTKDPIMMMAFKQPLMHIQQMSQLFQFEITTGMHDFGVWAQQSETLLQHHIKAYDTLYESQPDVYKIKQSASLLAHPNPNNNWFGYWGYFDNFNPEERRALESNPISLIDISVDDEYYMKRNPFKWTHLYGYYKDVMLLFTKIIFGDDHIKNAIPTMGQVLTPYLRFASVIRCQPLLHWFVQAGMKPSQDSINNVFFSPALTTFLADVNFEEFYRQNITRDVLVDGFNKAIAWKAENPNVDDILATIDADKKNAEEIEKEEKEKEEKKIQDEKPVIEETKTPDVSSETTLVVDDVDDNMEKKEVIVEATTTTDNEEQKSKTSPVGEDDDLMAALFGSSTGDNSEEQQKVVNDDEEETKKKEEAEKKAKEEKKSTTTAKKEEKKSTSTKKTTAAGAKKAETPPPPPPDVKLPPIQRYQNVDDILTQLEPFSLDDKSTFKQFLKTTTDQLFLQPYPHQENVIQGIYRTYNEHHAFAQMLFEMDCDYFFKSNHTDSCEKLVKFAANNTYEEMTTKYSDVLRQMQEIHLTAFYAQVPGSVKYDLKYLFKNPNPHNPKKPRGASSKSATNFGIQIEEIDEDHIAADYQTIFLVEQLRLIKLYMTLFQTKRSKLFSPLIYCFLTVIQTFPDIDESLRTLLPAATWIAQNSFLGHITTISRPDPLKDPVMADFLRMTLTVTMRYCSYNMFYQLRNNINMLAKYCPADEYNYQLGMVLFSNFSFVDEVNTRGAAHRQPGQPPDVEMGTLSFLSYMYPYLQTTPQFVLKLILSSPGVMAGINEQHVIYDLLHSFKEFQNDTNDNNKKKNLLNRQDTAKVQRIFDLDQEDKPKEQTITYSSAVQPIHYLATKLWNIQAQRTAIDKTKNKIQADMQKRFERCRSEREAQKLQEEFQMISQKVMMQEQQLDQQHVPPSQIAIYEDIIGVKISNPQTLENVIKAIGVKTNTQALEDSLLQKPTMPRPDQMPPGMMMPPGAGGGAPVNPLAAIQGAVQSQMASGGVPSASAAGTKPIGPSNNPALAARSKAKQEQQKKEQEEYEKSLDADMVLQSVHQAKEEQNAEGGILGSIFNSTNAWIITGVATLASAAYVGFKYWNGGSISDIISSVTGESSSNSDDDNDASRSSSFSESYSVDIKPVATTQTTNTSKSATTSVTAPKPVEPSGFKMSF